LKPSILPVPAPSPSSTKPSSQPTGAEARRVWEAGEAARGQRPESALRLFGKALRRDRWALASGIFLLLVALASLVAPWISPYGPNEANPVLRLGGIGTPGHLLGLDQQGRDMLTRLLWGGRVALPMAFIPVAAATVVSLLLGMVAGYYRRGIGELVMRLLDILYAFPAVLLAIAIAGILGPGMTNVMISIFIVLLPYMTRVVYTSTLTVAEEDFVTAARSSGAGDASILLREILPNVTAPMIVYATLSLGLQVVFAAGLSFLGLGVQPPTADWGVMTSDGRSVLALAPHVSMVPGVLLLLVALSFNLLGDGLRDALDPKLRV